MNKIFSFYPGFFVSCLMCSLASQRKTKWRAGRRHLRRVWQHVNKPDGCLCYMARAFISALRICREQIYMSVCWFPGFTCFSSQSEVTLVKLSKQNEQTKNTKHCYGLVKLKLLGIIQIDIQKHRCPINRRSRACRPWTRQAAVLATFGNWTNPRKKKWIVIILLREHPWLCCMFWVLK